MPAIEDLVAEHVDVEDRHLVRLRSLNGRNRGDRSPLLLFGYMIRQIAGISTINPTVPTTFIAVRWRDRWRATSSMTSPNTGPATNTATKNAGFQSQPWLTCSP